MFRRLIQQDNLRKIRVASFHQDLRVLHVQNPAVDGHLDPRLDRSIRINEVIGQGKKPLQEIV